MIYLHSLLMGLGIFVITFLFHIAVWRLFRLRREILWLFVLFILLPIVAGIVMSLLGMSIEYLFLAFFLHLSLAASYIQTYPALKEDIPSFRILLHVHDIYLQDSKFVSAENIVNAIGGQGLITSKLSELNNDRFLVEHQGGFQLTPSGRLLALIFHHYRRLLGLTTGRG